MSTMIDNITIIIPIVSLETDGEKEYLKKALQSIINQNDSCIPKNVLIVHSEEFDSETEASFANYNLNIKTIKNLSENPTISNQLNFGVDNIETDYFSYLEFDDEYSKIYFKNALTYLESIDELSILLTLGIDKNENGDILKYNNEISFSKELNEVGGELTHSGLLKMPYFTLSGAIFKKSDFIDIGKFKSNIKYTFFYEYLLRATDQCQKIVTLPKIGYVHTVNRSGSFSDKVSNDKTLTKEEMTFWYEAAKREFYFRTTDRVITYKPKVTV